MSFSLPYFRFGRTADINHHGRRRGRIGGLVVVYCGRLVNQFAVNLRAHRHFNQSVIDIAIDLGGGAEINACVRDNIALYETIQHHGRNLNGPLHIATVTDAQPGAGVRFRSDIAFNGAIQMQAAAELHIAIDVSAVADQRIDLERFDLIFTTIEHDGSHRLPIEVANQKTAAVAHAVTHAAQH